MNTFVKSRQKTGEESHEEVWVDKDECNRVNTTLEGLASLPPAFEDDGSVTAEASQLSNSASMTLMMMLIVQLLWA